MSVSFEKMPRTLDTAMFKREICNPGTEFAGDEGHGGDSLIPLSPAMGWVILLSRTATRAENKWLVDQGFELRARDEWRRPDRPDDFT